MRERQDRRWLDAHAAANRTAARRGTRSMKAMARAILMDDDTEQRQEESRRVGTLLQQLASPEPATRRAARDGIVAAAIEHMRSVAHRLLRGFPQVRRWDETDDVVQNASLRLSRALESVAPRDGRHLLALIALEVRRELLDLARKHGGPESFASNQETNVGMVAGNEIVKIGGVADPHDSGPESLSNWTRFHEAARELPDDERELFDLVWYVGVKQDEAAHLLGCSIRTVRRRWEAAKRHLLDRLGEHGPL
jgi:RNA polymerase sigma factor (sigma-70 family)